MTIPITHVFDSPKADLGDVTVVRPASNWDAAHNHSGLIDVSLLTTRGDLFRRGASAVERLPTGGLLESLISDGTDALPGKSFGKVLASSTFSAVSSLDIVLNNNFRSTKIFLYNVLPSTGATIYVRTSSNGGSSFDTGASDYSFVMFYDYTATAWGSVQDAAGPDGVALAFGDAQSDDSLTAEITIFNAGAARMTALQAYSHADYFGESLVCFAAGHRLSNADVDAVRIYPGTGTFSGSYIVVGVTG